MGRADQTTKVKGMFVRPEQIAEIGKRHPELGRLRLVVRREGEMDVMTLKAEAANADARLRQLVSQTLRSVTKLGGSVELFPIGTLPDLDRLIVDER
jgi:phenylacetate-CoA ligase